MVSDGLKERLASLEQARYQAIERERDQWRAEAQRLSRLILEYERRIERLMAALNPVIDAVTDDILFELEKEKGAQMSAPEKL